MNAIIKRGLPVQVIQSKREHVPREICFTPLDVVSPNDYRSSSRTKGAIISSLAESLPKKRYDSSPNGDPFVYSPERILLRANVRFPDIQKENFGRNMPFQRNASLTRRRFYQNRDL